MRTNLIILAFVNTVYAKTFSDIFANSSNVNTTQYYTNISFDIPLPFSISHTVGINDCDHTMSECNKVVAIVSKNSTHDLGPNSNPPTGFFTGGVSFKLPDTDAEYTTLQQFKDNLTITHCGIDPTVHVTGTNSVARIEITNVNGFIEVAPAPNNFIIPHIYAVPSECDNAAHNTSVEVVPTCLYDSAQMSHLKHFPCLTGTDHCNRHMTNQTCENLLAQCSVSEWSSWESCEMEMPVTVSNCVGTRSRNRTITEPQPSFDVCSAFHTNQIALCGECPERFGELINWNNASNAFEVQLPFRIADASECDSESPTKGDDWAVSCTGVTLSLQRSLPLTPISLPEAAVVPFLRLPPGLYSNYSMVQNKLHVNNCTPEAFNLNVSGDSSTVVFEITDGSTKLYSNNNGVTDTIDNVGVDINNTNDNIPQSYTVPPSCANAPGNATVQVKSMCAWNTLLIDLKQSEPNTTTNDMIDKIMGVITCGGENKCNSTPVNVTCGFLEDACNMSHWTSWGTCTGTGPCTEGVQSKNRTSGNDLMTGCEYFEVAERSCVTECTNSSTTLPPSGHSTTMPPTNGSTTMPPTNGSTTTKAPSSSGSDGLSAGKIAGIAVGTICAAGFLYYMAQWRNEVANGRRNVDGQSIELRATTPRATTPRATALRATVDRTVDFRFM